MSNKMKKFLYSVIALAFIFLSTYFFADLYMGKFNDNISKEKSTEVSDKSALDDSVKVLLFAGDKKERELTINDLKKDFNIDGSLTQTELIKRLKDEGYNLDIAENKEIMFKKDNSSLKPNMYYIGDKDNCLAIYKTDESGKPEIENNEDIYYDNKSVDSLSDVDKDKIKNFKLQYTSKEEAEEALSEFLS